MIRMADLPAAHPGRRLLTKRTPFFAAPGEPRCSYCAYVPRRWTPGAGTPGATPCCCADTPAAGSSPTFLYLHPDGLAPSWSAHRAA